ncbi:MAG: phosphodiester glycosidase family protein [Clostridia bacterium]|nr:phosphodiester glycosidase family protein [Clostridia bacterium]
MKPKKKPYPIWAVVTADFLLFCAALSVFCYFHHIRSLWGLGSPKSGDVQETAEVSADVPETLPVSADPVYDLTAEGDFPSPVFLPYSTVSSVNTVSLTDDTDIREYITASELPTLDSMDYLRSNYVGLYRSHDIYMTAQKIRTEIFYNSKEYEVAYYLYDVYIRNIENLFTSVVDDRIPIEEHAEASYVIKDSEGVTYRTDPAILALNGDYYGNDNMVYFAVRNSRLLRDTNHIGADICVLYSDGTMETYDAREFDRDAILAKNPWQVWEFGPSLLDENGEALTKFNENYYDDNVLSSRHPRSSIGYFEPGHYCFIVVDGRSDESDGVRLFQLGEIYESLGCTAAYNFDGGDSAQSLWMGEKHRVDEERIQSGQRKLYDAVMIGETEVRG